MQKRELLKRKAVEYLGGRCVDCGLQTDIIAVYDFHHKDMDEKAGIISDFLTVKKSWKAIQEELDKCVLLCANCHRIRHAQREETTSLVCLLFLPRPSRSSDGTEAMPVLPSRRGILPRVTPGGLESARV
jgi:hypothetical protein